MAFQGIPITTYKIIGPLQNDVWKYPLHNSEVFTYDVVEKDNKFFCNWQETLNWSKVRKMKDGLSEERFITAHSTLITLSISNILHLIASFIPSLKIETNDIFFHPPVLTEFFSGFLFSKSNAEFIAQVQPFFISLSWLIISSKSHVPIIYGCM